MPTSSAFLSLNRLYPDYQHTADSPILSLSEGLIAIGRCDDLGLSN